MITKYEIMIQNAIKKAIDTSPPIKIGDMWVFTILYFTSILLEELSHEGINNHKDMLDNMDKFLLN